MEDIKKEEVKDIKIEAENTPVTIELPENSPLRRIVIPHKKASRLVTEADIDRVVAEAKILHAICFESSGIYKGAYAMHHAQIDDKDPLNFFVTSNYKIVINPVITRHSGYTVDSKEGCVSYSGEKQVVVQRWQKIETEYVTIMVDPNDESKFKFSSKIEEGFSGMDAKVFQHEFDHGQAKYIHPFQENDIKKD